MKNFLKKGNVLNYANGSGAAVLAGSLIIVGALAGIAVTNIADGDTGAVNLTGVYQLPKANGAVSQGAKLYWDATNKVLTTTATSNTLVGVAYTSALAGDANVFLLLTNGI